jgi:hypothetical protein
MIKGFDSSIVSDVIDTVEVILKDTVGTTPPIDIKKIISMTNQHFNIEVVEGIEFNMPNKEHKTFAGAMLITRQKYIDGFNAILNMKYASLGARCLLMPLDKFYQNAKVYDFNLFDLKNEFYTNVSLEAIAQHLVDEFEVSVRFWTDNTFKYMVTPEEWGIPNFQALREYENMAIKEALNNKDRYSDIPVNEDKKITGWRVNGNKVILVYS